MLWVSVAMVRLRFPLHVFAWRFIRMHAFASHTHTHTHSVEYARRWLIEATGHTFDDVGMAYEIWDFPTATRLSDGVEVPFDAVPNGSGPERARPTTGSVIIWAPRGYFRGTGHVGIVTEATDTYALGPVSVLVHLPHVHVLIFIMVMFHLL